MMPVEGERRIWIDTAADRKDLAVFADRALRMDEAAVIRLRQRPGGQERSDPGMNTGGQERSDRGINPGERVVAWLATGFDVLASRVVAGRIRPADISVGADELARGLAEADHSGVIDAGFPMDSAWRGALPPDGGFAHLDDVPARIILDLAQRGSMLAREHSGAHGPPPSLLDQEVLAVSAGENTVGIPMRCVFALTAMGFLPPNADALATDEIVRVRVHPAWLRVDARFGTVYRRLGDPAMVLR
jgi:hypothetical protein